MIDTLKIFEDLKEDISPQAAKKIAGAIGMVYNELLNTVTKEEFRELRQIVEGTAIAQKELAEAQKRTEIKVEELAEAQKRTEIRVEELAEAQKRTEIRVEELAEAQKRTEIRVEELAEAQKRTEDEVKKLAIGLNRTREDLGGLSRSFGYAFENEAYRMLPKVLRRYGFEIKEKIIRAEIGEKEINFFGRAERNDKEVYIVGESRIRLDDMKKREDVFKELEEKIRTVKRVYGDIDVVGLLVTHFATKGFLKRAEGKGIIVVQSYEW